MADNKTITMQEVIDATRDADDAEAKRVRYVKELASGERRVREQTLAATNARKLANELQAKFEAQVSGKKAG